MSIHAINYNTDQLDVIYSTDKKHMNSPKQDGKYYIGLCDVYNESSDLIFSSSVSAAALFKYSFIDIIKYLYEFGITRISTPKIHIMQLNILPDNTYSVINKMYWIRLVQRHWKKIYNNNSNNEIKQTLRGMLSIYA